VNDPRDSKWIGVIRALQPADVPAVVAVHLHAFPGFFLSLLGSPFLGAYYRCFPGAPGAIALVAEVDGAISGFAVGAVNPAGFYRRLLRRHWLRFAIAALPALARDPRRARRILRAISHANTNPSGQGVAGLFSIASSPAPRVPGTGAELLEEFLARAGGIGATEAWLTTDADGNEAVNRFYQRAGFAVRRTFSTPEGRRMHEYARPLVLANSRSTQ
jgi:ribosomal protein S18 acetylase RimI-like enzyme